MRQHTLYQVLATAIQARLNCIESENVEWLSNWTERIEQLAKMLPSGSGWDHGTKVDLSTSHGEKIVLHGSFHHMNDGGMYDGWTEHTIVVTPSFSGINLRISGRNRNDIKEYLYQIFDADLSQPVQWMEPNGYQRVA